MLCRIWSACWAMSPSTSPPVAGSWATCPDRKSSPPPRTATENGRPDAGSWSLVTASRVMVGEFLSLCAEPLDFSSGLLGRLYPAVRGRRDRDPGSPAGPGLLRCLPGWPPQVSCQPTPLGVAGFTGPPRLAGLGNQIPGVLGGELPQDIWMHGALSGWIFVNWYRAGVSESGSAHNGTAIGDSGPGVAGLPSVAAAPPAACGPTAAADGPGILLRLWYSMAHSPARTAAAHYRCSKAGHRAGSDRGSPNHGSTLASKRVMAQIRSPARVST